MVRNSLWDFGKAIQRCLKSMVCRCLMYRVFFWWKSIKGCLCATGLKSRAYSAGGIWCLFSICNTGLRSSWCYTDGTWLLTWYQVLHCQGFCRQFIEGCLFVLTWYWFQNQVSLYRWYLRARFVTGVACKGFLVQSIEGCFFVRM